MLARRFSAEREDYAYIESCAYGTGYLDLLRVKRVHGVCEALGIRPSRPTEVVHIENMEVSYSNVMKYFNTTTTFKNAVTLFHKAVRVQVHLQAQERGARLIDETLLHRQLNLMLKDAPIGEGNRDPTAAQASQMNRAGLNRELDARIAQIRV